MNNERMSSNKRLRKEPERYTPNETLRNKKKEYLVEASNKYKEKRNNEIDSAINIFSEKCGTPIILSQEDEAFVYAYEISDESINNAWDVLPNEFLMYEDLCRSKDKTHYHIEINQFDKMDKGIELISWIRDIVLIDF
jgi:hypothetical protein